MEQAHRRRTYRLIAGGALLLAAIMPNAYHAHPTHAAHLRNPGFHTLRTTLHGRAAALDKTDIVVVSDERTVSPDILTGDTLSALGDHLQNTDGNGNAAPVPVVLVGSDAAPDEQTMLNDIYDSGAKKIIILGLSAGDRETLISDAQNYVTVTINKDPGSIASADALSTAIDNAQEYTPPQENNVETDAPMPSPADLSRDTAGPPPAVKVNLATSVDLSKYLPPVQNQGQESSCVGWATSYYYKTLQEARKRHWTVTDPAHQFSPAFVYNQINGGQDQGSTAFDAMQLMIKRGDVPLTAFPYTEGKYQAQPNSSLFQGAAAYKVAKHYKFFDYGEQGKNPPYKGTDIAKLKAWLAKGDGFVVGMGVGDSFQNYVGGVFSPDISREKNLGGHEMMVVGYSDNAAGTGIGAFRIVNSWGSSWGEHGFAWVSYSYFTAETGDAYAMTTK